MNAMKIKYLKGNLCSEGFDTDRDKWLKIWIAEVEQAKKNGRSLVVVELPNGLEWLDFGAKIDFQIQQAEGEEI